TKAGPKSSPPLERRPADAEHTGQVERSGRTRTRKEVMGKEPNPDEGKREFEEVHGEEADLGPPEDVVEVGGAGDLDELEDIDEVGQPERPAPPQEPERREREQPQAEGGREREPGRGREPGRDREPGR